MNNANSARFRAQKISGPLQWLRVYKLYRSAFPRSERKPFSMIVKMCQRGKTDVWVLMDGCFFAGFATTINDESLILLDYLAVPGDSRGRGYGTAMLETLKAAYPGKGLFVEIESPFEDVPNRRERVCRRNFYIHGGFTPARVMAAVFGVKMELLCHNCHVDFPRYHAFYRDNYSPWAAGHILPEIHPEGDKNQTTKNGGSLHEIHPSV